MQTHNLTQGSHEWLVFRASHRTASDAPAMLGISPYKSRDALLQEKATCIRPEVDAATQRRFDEGHRLEALARPLAEKIIGDELYPVTGSSDEYPRLAASFDGLTMIGDTAWEHKTLNAALREALQSGDAAGLPAHYRAQLEQQCLVSGCSRILFMASRWEGDELAEEMHVWYEPDPAMRQRLIDGWAQFDADLTVWQPKEAAQKATGHAPETLPALRIEVTGQVTASNLADFRAHALAVFGGINRDLKTDQDFADAEATVKWCGEVEDKLKAAKQHALSQTASIDALFRTIDDIAAEARRVRLELDKLVKARKDAIRAEIVHAGQKALLAHIETLNAGLGQPLMPAVAADFAGAVKSKRTVESLRAAVDAELARAKAEASATAARIAANVRLLAEANRPDLFPDVQALALKNADDLQAVITARVAEHERLQAERAAAAKVAEQAAAPAAPPAPAETAAPPAGPASQPQTPPDTPPALKLGDINERIAPLSITADGLRQLGFEPAGHQRRACLYHEAQWPAIRAALLGCINRN